MTNPDQGRRIKITINNPSTEAERVAQARSIAEREVANTGLVVNVRVGNTGTALPGNDSLMTWESWYDVLPLSADDHRATVRIPSALEAIRRENWVKIDLVHRVPQGQELDDLRISPVGREAPLLHHDHDVAYKLKPLEGTPTPGATRTR